MYLALTLQMKLAVRSTEIRGFSYAFLRLLVDTAMELRRDDRLFEERKDRGGSNNRLSSVGAIILNHIGKQTHGSTGWSNIGTSDPAAVNEVIDAAQHFLDIFELSHSELIESQRTPEHP